MNGRVPAALLVCTLAAWGCGGNVATRNWTSSASTSCHARSATHLTTADRDADLDTLRRTLERGYAGYRRAGSDEDWDRVFADLRAASRALGRSVSGARFRDLLAAHLRFLEDNHVGFWTYEDGTRQWRGVGGHHQAHLASMRLIERDGTFWSERWRLVECGGHPPRQVLARVLGAYARTEWRPLILAPRPLRALRCTFATEDGSRRETRSLPLTAIDLGDDGGPPFTRRSAPFPWLRLRTLAMTERRRLAAFVASAEEVRHAPVVVLDLRGAEGGSDRFLLRFFEDLTDRELLYWHRTRLRSEVVAQGALDFWTCVRADHHGAVDPWVSQRIQRARREIAQIRRPFYALDSRQTVMRGRAPAPFDGILVLVVDRGCQSACETAVLLARQLPGAIVVGENTGGVMKVGEIRRYRLPRSGVHLSLGHQAHDDPTGSFREGYGFLPDLWLDGGNPERDIRALVACLADAGRDDCGRVANSAADPAHRVQAP